MNRRCAQTIHKCCAKFVTQIVQSWHCHHICESWQTNDISTASWFGLWSVTLQRQNGSSVRKLRGHFARSPCCFYILQNIYLNRGYIFFKVSPKISATFALQVRAVAMLVLKTLNWREIKMTCGDMTRIPSSEQTEGAEGLYLTTYLLWLFRFTSCVGNRIY
jgi:hypothetical protein